MLSTNAFISHPAGRQHSAMILNQFDFIEHRVFRSQGDQIFIEFDGTDRVGDKRLIRLSSPSRRVAQFATQTLTEPGVRISRTWLFKE
jgi:hypothetical protein